MIRVGRRQFLLGAGGLMYALPALEGLATREARAGVSPAQFLMVYAQPMGVCQAVGDRPENYWPNFAAGALSQANLAAAETAGRTLGMLKDFANDVAIIRGVRPLTNGEGHEVGKAQILTGSSFHFTDPTDHHSARPLTEDISSRFARELGGGSITGVGGHVLGDPVGTYIWNSNLSQGDVDYNPRDIYNRLFAAPLAADVIASRTSVNDRVRSELTSLRSSPKLSVADRQRLDQHADSIRLIEKRLSCGSPDPNSPLKKGVDSVQVLDSNADNIEAAHKLHLALIAFGLNCGAFRTVRFFGRGGAKGRGTDMFDATAGEFQNGLPQELHEYSHRVGAQGEAFDSWKDRLTRLDHWHQRRFTEFLKQLKDYGILDSGITIYHSEVATGGHDQYNVPFVIAGSAGGRLKLGQYINATPVGGGFDDGGIRNNKLLATIGAALGLQDKGAPITQFGGTYENGTQEPGGYVDALKGSNFPA